MKHRPTGVLRLGVCFGMALALAPASLSGTPKQKGKSVMRATGPFDVKLKPQAMHEEAAGSTLGRMSIDKQFRGDLEATSRGEMLTAMSDVKGSGGYVAVERVTGKLHGRSGSFSLQHSGTMNRGAPSLTITVVPDSGTGELPGLSGKMNIFIASDRKHSYDFEYTLSPAD